MKKIIITSILIALIFPLPAFAKGGKAVLCSLNGVITAKAKCKKGETRVNIDDLVKQAVSVSAVQGPVGPQGPQGDQGPQGPQGVVGPLGVQGPVGPKGDPASFKPSNCYSKEGSAGGPSGFPAGVNGNLTIQCNNPASEFMLSASYNPVPSGSQTNKPIVQSKSFILDSTNKYPVGVAYIFTQVLASPSGNYGAAGEIICCVR